MNSASRTKRGTGRDAILDAALRLIGQRGLHSLTMRDIAAAAGTSLGSTTYHFSDRDALLSAALERFADDEIERLERLLRRLADQRASPIDMLAALVDELNHTVARPGYAVAQLELYVAASRDPQLSQIAIKCITAYQKVAERALLAAEIPAHHAPALARWITTLIDGFALHAAAAGTPQRPADDLSEAIEALVST